MSSQPAAAVPLVALDRPAGLQGVQFDALVRELVHRLDGVKDRHRVRLLIELGDRLEKVLAGSANRYSHTHLQELLGTYFFWHAEFSGDLQGETFLELGAGSENPLAVASAFHMLGAARAYGLEWAPLLSAPRQAKAIASNLYWLAMRHDLFTKFDLAPFRGRIVERVGAYDLAQLSAGVLKVPGEVALIQASASATGLPSNSVDRVVSSAFLEHPCDLEGVVAEIARVTRPGGLSIHNVDTVDHGVYDGMVDSPIAFLLEAEGDEMVRGSNRLRIFQIQELFEHHGFELLKRTDYHVHEWTEEQLAARVTPFSGMSPTELAPLRSVLVFRRQASPR